MLKLYWKSQAVPNWLVNIQAVNSYEFKFCRLVLVYNIKGVYHIRPILTQGYFAKFKGSNVIVDFGAAVIHSRPLANFIWPILAVYALYKLLGA